MQEGTEEFLEGQRTPRNAVQIYFLFDTLKYFLNHWVACLP